MKSLSGLRLAGIMLIVVGIIMMIIPEFVGASIAVVLGLSVLLAGAGVLASAWSARSVGGSVWGALIAAGGLYITFNPTKTSITITALLAAYLVVSGAVRLVWAAADRDLASRAFVGVSGALALGLGALVWARWPGSGEVFLGIMLGIDFVLMGAALMLVPKQDVDVVAPSPRRMSSLDGAE